MPSPSSRRRPLIVVAATLSAFGIGLCGGMYVAFLTICAEVHYEADYAGVTFFREGQEFTSLDCNNIARCTLIVDVPGHGRFPASEAPVEVIDAFCDDNLGTGFYEGENCHWIFRDGKLESFSISKGSPIRISSRADREFVKLPISPRRLRELWGQPQDSRKVRRKKVYRFTLAPVRPVAPAPWPPSRHASTRSPARGLWRT